MTILNLTPHAIVIRSEGNGVDTTFPASGQIARCASCQTPDAPVDGFHLVVNSFGDVMGLPDPAPGVIYLVSTPVAQHPSIAGKRLDVVAPNTGSTAIRENGQIVAVRGFQRF